MLLPTTKGTMCMLYMFHDSLNFGPALSCLVRAVLDVIKPH